MDETMETIDNEEIMDENAEFAADETEGSNGPGLGTGILIGAVLAGAGFALKKGFDKVKPVIQDKIAERKAKKAEKKAKKDNDRVVIEESK